MLLGKEKEGKSEQEMRETVKTEKAFKRIFIYHYYRNGKKIFKNVKSFKYWELCALGGVLMATQISLTWEEQFRCIVFAVQ